MPTYPLVKKPEVDPVARSIAKPGAFSKPGSMGKMTAKAAQKTSVRFRPLKANPARVRKRKPDPRNVKFY